jgi:hypothetical protein
MNKFELITLVFLMLAASGIIVGNDNLAKLYKKITKTDVLEENPDKHSAFRSLFNWSVSLLSVPFAIATVISASVLVGSYVTGILSPHGNLVLENGARYEGGLSSGKMSGHGVYIFPSESPYLTYSGDFVNGERDGQGTLIWRNGNRYDGEFHKGKREGQGELFWFANRERYKGEFRNDRMTGRGDYFLADGTRSRGVSPMASRQGR